MNTKYERTSGKFLSAAMMLVAGVVAVAQAADWSNSGGNAGRNCLTSEIGPDHLANLTWTYTERSTRFAWQPVIEGPRMFVIRQTVLRAPEPPPGNGSPVVAIDLETGVELWHTDLPLGDGEYPAWIAGVKDGLVFACRGSTGWHEDAPMYALRVADGSVAWTSHDGINTGPTTGVVFADNGDLIIGSLKKLQRIRWTDGSTAWETDRVGVVADNSGAAIFGNGVYIVDYDLETGGRNCKIIKHDINTGVKRYESPLMFGGTVQNTPVCGPDGTIYLSRTAPNAPDGLDKFYAYRDTGTALIEKWHVPAGYSQTSEFGVGPDGTVYMIAPGNIIQRLNPLTGAVINSSAPIAMDSLSYYATPRFAIDGEGKVFFSNGAQTSGTLYSFNADLTERWSVSVPKAYMGGPALGQNGTLVQAGHSDIRAWRTDRTTCPVDLNGDGVVDFADYLEFLNLFDAGDLRADFNHDGIVDFGDYLEFLNQFDAGC